MRRRQSVVFVAVAVTVGLVALPAPLRAQGFFETLFGGGSSPAYRPPQPIPYSYRAPPYNPYAREHVHSREERSSDFEPRSGRYRTLCVRMCDGYYWPVSFAATRSSMNRDANVCRASCGEETRLFYHDSRQGDTKDMVDMSGRAYAKLQTAYLYRKRLSDSCKCRPEPWAQSELDRHRIYAMNDATRQLNGNGNAVAGFEPLSRQGPGFEAIAGKYPEPEPKPMPVAAVSPAVATPEPAVPLPDATTTPVGSDKPEVSEVVRRPKAQRKAPSSQVAREGQRPPRGKREPGPIQARAPHPSGNSGGPFGLGAGSQKLRWPGE